jgi:hypothetical protein
MPKKSSFPELNIFFSGYLNQDYSYHGETIEEVIDVYRKNLPLERRWAAISEVEKFESEYAKNLEEMFSELYEREVSISAWGYTTKSFLKEFKRRLSEL